MDTAGRYAPLFEPLAIGPVTAPNRFYQVPHCTGMGHALPQTLAAMRGMKAEGGWGVVCTEYCSIHPSSDDHPWPFAALWDDGDVRNLAAMASAVHAHGALAGVELWHGGSSVANLASRAPTLGVRSTLGRSEPIQSQRMDRRDIREFRRWHRAAALRARQADFDIVYVYPTHGYLVAEFLSRASNTRSDAYGGTLANRMRLLRELLEETREAVGDRCAVAVRFSASGHGDEHLSADEAHDVIAALGALPDLWDLVIADYDEEMGSSRFVRQGALEDRIAYVRQLTGRPVVSVGRFTSPDAMLSQVRRGIVDFIGAARPSIADPFLPHKIREGRSEDIRECIGCNICYAHNSRGSALRCTQNPTMGEEWRSGWHPEHVTRDGAGSVLIVGAGPAGLEAGQILGKRGFQVTIADAATEAGGRVSREARLPGLAEWGRVRDYRLGQIERLANVELHLGSRLEAADVREFGADHVLVATGSRWRRDGRGRSRSQPLAIAGDGRVLTPDDVLDGARPTGTVVVYDDDHYYMAAVLAELLAGGGARVRFVTTAGSVGPWLANTAEQARSQRALLELGVTIEVSSSLERVAADHAVLSCIYTGAVREVAADVVLTVTDREPEDSLYRALVGERETDEAAAETIQRIGDCLQPALIAHAVYAGHRAARGLGTAPRVPARDRLVL